MPIPRPVQTSPMMSRMNAGTIVKRLPMEDELSSNVTDVMATAKYIIPRTSNDFPDFTDSFKITNIPKMSPAIPKGITIKKALCQPNNCVMLPPIRGPNDRPR